MAKDKVEPLALTAGLSPQAIRAAVLEEERFGFERQYREAMAVPACTRQPRRPTLRRVVPLYSDLSVSALQVV